MPGEDKPDYASPPATGFTGKEQDAPVNPPSSAKAQPIAAAASGVAAVMGHRGTRGNAPENTLAGIRRAAELGATWIEFDTKLTRDGQAVVIHDDTLERTTDGKGQVAETDLNDIRALDAGSWFGREFTGERVPTLKETIALLVELNLGANVEIKPTPGREAESGRVIGAMLAAAVQSGEWPNTLPPPMICSFKHPTLAAVRQVAPDLERALLVLEFPDDWRSQLAAEDCRALHCLYRHLTVERARAVIEAGFHLRCFTVNKRKTAERLWSWGVETMITDYPERLLGALPRQRPPRTL